MPRDETVNYLIRVVEACCTSPWFNLQEWVVPRQKKYI